MRLLAVSSAKRLADFPDVPTAEEAGVPGYDVSLWYSILAPAGTPAPIVARLSAEIAKALTAPDVRDRLIAQGFEITYLNSEQMNDLMKRDIARWGKSLREIGLKLDQ